VPRGGLAGKLSLNDCDRTDVGQVTPQRLRDELESLRLGEWVAVRKEIDPIWLENLFEGFLSRPEGSDTLG
jgi:hypothetical protein